MKVRVNTDIILDIPGEFQDDDMAISLIDQTLRDMLYVGVEYDPDDLPSDDFLPIDHLEIRNYFVLSGRVTPEDIELALKKQRENY